MINNYRVDMSSQPQPDVLRISGNSSKTVWRVYFDREEVESEQTRGEGEEPEITIQYRAKFIEVTLASNVTPVPIDILRAEVIKEINAYDVSPSVNGFKLNDALVWLDKDTRVGLMNSTTIQKAAGLEETILWLGETPLRINCDLAIQLLSALELYALECFNKTAEHRKNVLALETIDEILAYNYTQGYPEMLDMHV
jgi:hypothetical protein